MEASKPGPALSLHLRRLRLCCKCRFTFCNLYSYETIFLKKICYCCKNTLNLRSVPDMERGFWVTGSRS